LWCYRAASASHTRQRYFREVWRESDVTEMTLLQTTVFQVGNNGGNTAYVNDKNYYATEASILKIAVRYIYIYTYIRSKTNSNRSPCSKNGQ
jgi:hypothetical protein